MDSAPENNALSALQILPEIYRDAAQPAAREVGSALGRAVRMALAPVRALVWSAEQAEDWLETAVTKKLERRGVSSEDVLTPAPDVAARAIRAVQIAGPAKDETLREMFAGILATSMEGERAVKAHPAFIEILTQISTDEAKLLMRLAYRSPSPLVRRVVLSTVEGVLPVDIGEPSVIEPLAQEVQAAALTLSLAASLENLQRLGLITLVSERFTLDQVGQPHQTNKPHIGAQIDRWNLFRSYLLDYGDVSVAKAVSDFEAVPLDSDTDDLRSTYVRSGKRPSIVIDAIWASEFGKHLLDVAVEARVDHTDNSLEVDT